ncbi:polysaccharide lyase beta-sandwich domain-containing protein [Curtobacterium sp. MCBD17_003]|uniref:polysaccharide lyase beta-sandwich domain-containing protein n=1 Tax=Curtobacterium sp. MCBD17_003 TaxID=2175667 RepID=UPI000DA8EE32|nr:polysaccharide lyase beta-sandwich domain-containing protein [Curtobacterium sp. MCBD17_003]WIE55632.1 polysaccharide lyase beta-sandwich domain-containing protein [Curtobacterium sp. MCBD17_003]
MHPSSSLLPLVPSDGVTMTNFWATGAPKTAGIQVSGAASVVTQRADGTLAVAVSDPTQRRTDTVTVTVDGAATGVVSTDSGVTVVSTSPNTTISVPLSGAAGRSFTARFTV